MLNYFYSHTVKPSLSQENYTFPKQFFFVLYSLFVCLVEYPIFRRWFAFPSTVPHFSPFKLPLGVYPLSQTLHCGVFSWQKLQQCEIVKYCYHQNAESRNIISTNLYGSKDNEWQRRQTFHNRQTEIHTFILFPWKKGAPFSQEWSWPPKSQGYSEVQWYRTQSWFQINCYWTKMILCG